MKAKGLTLLELLVVILILALIFFLFPIIVRKLKRSASLIGCQKNLKALGNSLQKYAADNNGLYPTASKWCDLLVEKTGIYKDKFCCRSVGDSLRTTNTPIDEMKIPVQVKFLRDYNDSEGQKKYIYEIEWSHYGLNPNAEPKFPHDVVLLFETEHGWNQFGGPELVRVKNHLQIYGKEGCNILFNDGRVKFIRPQKLGKLNWGDKQKE